MNLPTETEEGQTVSECLPNTATKKTYRYTTGHKKWWEAVWKVYGNGGVLRRRMKPFIL
jgi:hypothetical protein